MNPVAVIVISSICLALVIPISEFILSILGKEYNGYLPPHHFSSFARWAFSSWNYIGAKNFHDRDFAPVRHVGVRWFGHEWEQIIEIPMGELRF